MKCKKFSNKIIVHSVVAITRSTSQESTPIVAVVLEYGNGIVFINSRTVERLVNVVSH